MATPAAAAPAIKKLDPAVINRIAAGEVVQRPASAIKELLENSLDAGATSITVTVKNGGLAMFQITDNGHGIRKEDLAIVCERFTTSKLCEYDDLRSISTFGFRGEALASVSHVAVVTILTRTSHTPYALRARYRDSKLVPLSPGDKSDPKPCAGVQGTTITVEDLFHNMPTRRVAFKNTAEEFQKILDVVTRYSVFYADKGVGFVCKKHGQAVPDLHTPSGGSSSDVIKQVYGPQIARELVDLCFDQDDYCAAFGTDADESRGALRYQVRGKVTNANFSQKKSVFILFINNRLVESSNVKRAVEGVYAELLPRHAHPFAFLAIEMPGDCVDVNVHPTKREVHFLHEEALLGHLAAMLRRLLDRGNDSRTFRVQTILPSLLQVLPTAAAAEQQQRQQSTDTIPLPDSWDGEFGSVGSPVEHENENADLEDDVAEDVADELAEEVEAQPGRVVTAMPGACNSPVAPTSAIKRRAAEPEPAVRANKFVRVDHRAQPIDRFFKPLPAPAVLLCQVCESPRTQACLCCETVGLTPAAAAPAPTGASAMIELRASSCSYSSVVDVSVNLRASHSQALTACLRASSFVGIMDARHCLLQHATRLLLVNHQRLLEQLFFQLCFHQFRDLHALRLHPPIDVRRCLVAVEETDCEESEAILRQHAEMLREYFAVGLEDNSEGALQLVTLPVVVPGHVPALTLVPLFLHALATHAVYTEERACFESVARVLATFYARFPPGADVDVLRTLLFPVLQKHLLVQPAEGLLIELTSLEKLYKIFERC